jgi:two-component system phosphate regulon response regulator PhoB
MSEKPMQETKILVVEDDIQIQNLLKIHLAQKGFVCYLTDSINQASQIIKEQAPDLIILDWMLPHSSGVSFAKKLRQNQATATTPILMLTAKSEEEDIMAGLEAGADDYLSKPFSLKELTARILALLRRAQNFQPPSQPILSAGPFTFNQDKHEIQVFGQPLHLGPTEHNLLSFLMKHPLKAFTRHQFLDAAWQVNVCVEERTVDVHMRRLRKQLALHTADHLLETVRGVGYRLNPKGEA